MMTARDLIPKAKWTSCGEGLPEVGKFVWVVVGKTIICGEACRYVREVHMGVYDGDRGFAIHPYKVPIVSNQVWAWAPIVPPQPPFVVRDGNKEIDNDDYNDDEID